jgi:hypothetical protein
MKVYLGLNNADELDRDTCTVLKQLAGNSSGPLRDKEVLDDPA